MNDEFSGARGGLSWVERSQIADLQSQRLIEPFPFVRYDIAGPKPFQALLPSRRTACFGRVASKSARKAALSEYSGFKAGPGFSGAGISPCITRASSDGGLDTAAAPEDPTGVVAFGS